MPLQNGGETCIVAVERHRCDVVHCPELGTLLEDVVQQTEACRLLRLALVVELRRQRFHNYERSRGQGGRTARPVHDQPHLSIFWQPRHALA